MKVHSFQKPVESYVMFLGARGRRKRALPGWVCQAQKGNKQSRQGHQGSKRPQRSGSSPHRVITGLPPPTAEVKHSCDWPALSGGEGQAIRRDTTKSPGLGQTRLLHTQSPDWEAGAPLQPCFHSITIEMQSKSTRHYSAWGYSLKLGHLCAYLLFPSRKPHFQSPGRSLTALC